jgi:hypothetical protein
MLIAVPEEAIFLVMHTLLEPGGHAVVVTPAYQSLYEVARGIGCPVTRLDLEPRRGAWHLLAGLRRGSGRMVSASARRRRAVDHRHRRHVASSGRKALNRFTHDVFPVAPYTMKFSVVVPAYQAAKVLPMCIGALQRQTIDRAQYEIIVSTTAPATARQTPASP